MARAGEALAKRRAWAELGSALSYGISVDGISAPSCVLRTS